MIDIGRYTTFQTSNVAKNFYDISSDSDLQNFLSKHSIDKNTLVFGGGSNLLFSKPSYEDKVFVRNIHGGISYIGDDLWSVKAGQRLSSFVSLLSQEHGINTLHPIFAIPGTIGGAVMGNAGSYGVEIGNFVRQITYADENGLHISDDYRCEYRNSNIKNKNILLTEIVLHIPRKWDDNIQSYQHYLTKSLETKEYNKTCGSYFKNYILSDRDTLDIFEEYDDCPLHQQKGKDNMVIPAGWMIDKCGLRGYDIGGVKISEKHANFIVNYDNDDAQKILDLAKLIKHKVFEKFKVILKEEVIII